MAIAVNCWSIRRPVLLQEYQRLIGEEIELSRLAEDDVNLPAQLKSGEAYKSHAQCWFKPGT